MKFMDLVSKRQSVRSYLPEPVEREKIERCLEASRLAPSACNSQPWQFIVVDDPSLKDAVAKATFGKIISFNHFSLSAPVIVLIAAEKAKVFSRLGSIIKNKSFTLIDIGIAAEHFCLQAAEEGLGTCMLGWFAEKSIRKILSLPKSLRTVLAITVGYPADEQVRVKQRRTLEEVRQYNRG
jgi:nitroreductase